ncbi:hypothetical protein P153DRAFT_38541 [Dothidotthia symphoricarpi CBS 119687]|uniref:Uncharacterized protein n=1 Tax=Dothidotthia symphoricarpi CBS 119687 TaxID=1392245 RepID=A0A6A6ABE1_9PLEO|nr:uncharacterized protein P153DRAFT_38541 [Dothidotthia symphoricarpi CBS 119687]KAF2128475.1 hypothetical protein P153DRAFT_38541 [Dothidotthia symphoricarpi CBS 119687]
MEELACTQKQARIGATWRSTHRDQLAIACNSTGPAILMVWLHRRCLHGSAAVDVVAWAVAVVVVDGVFVIVVALFGGVHVFTLQHSQTHQRINVSTPASTALSSGAPLSHTQPVHRCTPFAAR